MQDRTLGFFARLWLAIWLPWKILFDALMATRILRLLAPPEAQALPDAAEPSVPKPDPRTALHLLAILQREGRFIDFLQEDVTSVADEQVGAAARVVQQGCRAALSQYVRFEPVRTESEGAPLIVEAGFDPVRLRLTGNVVGQAPFRGRLAHHGWRAIEVRLPAPPDGQDLSIVAPAEVEIA